MLLLCLSILQTLCYANDEYTLPSTIVPINYDITLFPHLHPDANGNFSFDAWQTIELNLTIDHIIKYPNDSFLFIQLNQGININLTSLISLNISDLQIHFTDTLNTSFNPITEIITFTFNITNGHLLSLLATNNIEYGLSVFLSLQWHSPFTDNYGLYLSPYNYTNLTLYGIGTQMQPIYARWVIPMYDEPKYRPTYDITFIAPIHATTLSNMAMQRTVNLTDTNTYECQWISHTGQGMNDFCKIVSFQRTPPMPSYLLAFVIGDYDYLSTKVLNYTQTLYFELNRSNEYTFALNTSQTVMPWFVHTLNVSYPLSKLDDVSLEGGGAMENWGLVIYCDVCIATKDSYTSRNQRPLVGLMGHEYAHQWFGNLVTINSWEHTWLNEGFARYLEYVVGNATRPDLPFWETWYGYGPWPGRLDNDISIFTPPIIKANISTQDEIRSMFSSTTYDKGACINRMLAYYMGENNYFRALNEYLNTYQYQSVASDQLLDILIKYDTRNPDTNAIKTMMHSWLNQPGYPVLYIDITEMNDSALLVTLSQKRNIKEGIQFFATDTDNNILGHDIYPYYDTNTHDIETYQNSLWNIPIYYKNIKNETKFVTILNESETSFVIERENINKKEFYYFNPEYANFYRTAYSSKLSFEWLYKSINSLTEWEAYSLLFDSLQLMQSQYITPVTYLEMISFVIKPNIISTDTIFYFWDRLYDGLVSIDSLLCEYYILDRHNQTTLDLRHNFHEFGRHILQPMLHEIDGWNYKDSDSDYVPNIRWRIIDLSIRFDNTHIIEDGYHILQNAMAINNISVINTDLLRQVFAASFYYCASKNSDNIYEEMMNIYKENNNDNIRQKWLQSIGYLYQNEAFVNEIYSFVMSEVDNDMKSMGLNSLAEIGYARQYLWNNMKLNDFNDWNVWFGIAANAAIQSFQNFGSEGMYNETFEFFYFEQGLMHNIQSNLTLQSVLTNLHWISNGNDQFELAKYLQNYVDDLKEEESVETVMLVWLLCAVGLAIVLIVFAVVMFRKSKRRNIPNNPNYYEMENANYYGSTTE